MGVSLGPNGVKDGLIFSFDLNNQQKSWKGKPTTNYAANRSARVDNSYASFSATSSGAWNQNHPDAITVYNDSGSNISAYSNTGVTDWTNTYHAIWTLDSQLNRPVVTMRDVDGQWKAKSFSLGQTMTTMGLAAGSTYSISWLQWTDDIAKAIQAGLYGLNTGGTNNFNDGLSLGQSTSYNTLPYTWQRVYATFTVSSSWNMTAGIACYMYGHYVKRGTLKITDVQIEVGTPSGFSKSLTRSSSQSLINIIDNQAATISDLTYENNNSFTFDGTNDLITCGTFSAQYLTLSAWVYKTSSAVNQGICRKNYSWAVSQYGGGLQVAPGTSWAFYNTGYTIPLNTWINIAYTYSGTGATGSQRVYINGTNIWSSSVGSGSLPANSNPVRIGYDDNSWYWGGRISNVQIYNKALTELEVKQNFNALRGRYNL